MLYKDPHCQICVCLIDEGYYCEEHITPKPAIFPNFDYPNKFAKWKQKGCSHLCPSYYDYLIKKEK
jgi:hypothetical protein